MSKLNHIDLVIGDWSGDGHMQTETVGIVSHSTADEISAAYKNGLKKGFPDLVKLGASEHEQPWLQEDFTLQFVKALWSTDTECFSEDDRDKILDIVMNGTIFEFKGDLQETSEVFRQIEGITSRDFSDYPIGEYLEGKGFAILYLAICHVGNPSLTLAFDDECETINIGGYGLFCS